MLRRQTVGAAKMVAAHSDRVVPAGLPKDQVDLSRAAHVRSTSCHLRMWMATTSIL